VIIDSTLESKMAAVVNNYKPSTSTSRGDQSRAFRIPYDLNCSIAVPTILENERVAIVPFVPSIHAEPFFEEFNKANAELSKYLPIVIGDTLDDFVRFVEIRMRRWENAVLFAIIDKTKPRSRMTESTLRTNRRDNWMDQHCPNELFPRDWTGYHPSRISRDVCNSQRHWTSPQTSFRVPHQWRIGFQTRFLGC
jgi:hypothetical protein